MAESGSRIRNIILAVLALACLGYAARSVWKTTRVPPASNADVIRIVCTACWEEASMTTEESEAAEHEETGAIRCPSCGEYSASTITLRCPDCKRAVPRSMVVIGSAYVCPFCKASLAPDPTAAPQP